MLECITVSVSVYTRVCVGMSVYQFDCNSARVCECTGVVCVYRCGVSLCTCVCVGGGQIPAIAGLAGRPSFVCLLVFRGSQMRGYGLLAPKVNGMYFSCSYCSCASLSLSLLLI